MIIVIKVCDHHAAIGVLLPVKNIYSFFNQFQADTFVPWPVSGIVLLGKLPPDTIVCYRIYDVFIFELCCQVQAQ